jgi:hypothetical protein
MRRNLQVYVRLGTDVAMEITDFWHVMPCDLADRCKHFKITCCLRLQGRKYETLEDGGSGFM